MRAILTLLLLTTVSHAQSSHFDSLSRWRREYKEAFTKDDHSPLTAADTGSLRFYPISESYRVIAHVRRTKDAPTLNLPTSSGINKRYWQWGVAQFSLNGKKLTLRLYKSPDLMQRPGLEEHLAVFFNDLTNYDETYAGGRYIDLKTSDVSERGTLIIDFNKAYNPYCAYAEGYACPIPPAENRLKVEVKAGEKLYAGPHKE